MRKIFHLPIEKLPLRGILTAAFKQDKWSVEGLDVILSFLKDVRRYENAWFIIYVGKYKNKKIFAAKHPIGSSGTEILLEEAYTGGARKMLRVGSCYGIRVSTGDIVVPKEVVLGEVGVAKAQGYSRGDILKFDKGLIKKLKEEFSKIEASVYYGRIISDDYFNTYITEQKKWLKKNLLANEMECSEFAIFYNKHRNTQIASILVADGCLKSVKSTCYSRKEREIAKKNYQTAVKVALDILVN